MKAGAIVRLADGREGTVVYNGLDGVGIKWGRHYITLDDLYGHGGIIDEEPPDGYQWYPDAMLRDHYPGADLPCVGAGYVIVDDEEAEAEETIDAAR